MKKVLIASAVGFAILALSSGHVESQKTDNLDKFMRAKLIHSQKVLEGLATEDFFLIAKHSQKMSLLSQAAAWQVLQTPEYRQHSIEFRRSCDTITEAAKKKNLDAAALAYLSTTLKCINCHKYVRGVRMAHLDQTPFDQTPFDQTPFDQTPFDQKSGTEIPVLFQHSRAAE